MWGDTGAGFGYLGTYGPVSDLSVSLEIVRFKWDSIRKHFVNGEAPRRWKVQLVTRLMRARFSLCWPQMWYRLATLCAKLGTGSRLQLTFDWMVPLVKPASGSLGSRSYFSLVKNPEKLTWRFKENLKGQKRTRPEKGAPEFQSHCQL